jgi:hypothetical protein
MADSSAEYHLSVSNTQNEEQVAARLGNVTAMVQIGSVAGALIAFFACDKIGELVFTDSLDWPGTDQVYHQVVSGRLVNSALYGLSGL